MEDSMTVKKLFLVLTAAMALASPVIAEELPKQPSLERVQVLRNQRTFMMNCINDAIDRFDDRISPASVVASAVAWYCEAEGDPEKYWIILSSRRSTPDTVDAFYRDRGLPLALPHRPRES